LTACYGANAAAIGLSRLCAVDVVEAHQAFGAHFPSTSATPVTAGGLRDTVEAEATTTHAGLRP
jgi:hypothetical protein